MRKTKPKKRILLPDPKYHSTLVTRFVNDLMKDGKKSLAYSIFYDTLDLVEKRMKDNEVSSLEVWKKALENVTPAVEVKSRRVGGATFQVPMEIRQERKVAISIKNLILFAQKRS
ncbi:MAG: 30S ribosomal protein S7, partial [Mariniphaga sp.]|nr:30S ribosomal protein S7 [Mariniphaga sp.]